MTITRLFSCTFLHEDISTLLVHLGHVCHFNLSTTLASLSSTLFITSFFILCVLLCLVLLHVLTSFHLINDWMFTWVKINVVFTVKFNFPSTVYVSELCGQYFLPFEISRKNFTTMLNGLMHDG